MRNPSTRPGFTLLELLLVLALLIILAAVTLPSFSGLQGNVRQKAAADTLRARIADARGRAMEHGTAYRLAVSADGTRLRLAPDGLDFGELPADDPPSGASRASEDRLDKATVTVAPDPQAGSPPADGSGWVTIATFLPSGTCRETSVIVEVAEANFPPIRLQVRGATGGSRVLPTRGQNGGAP